MAADNTYPLIEQFAETEPVNGTWWQAIGLPAYPPVDGVTVPVFIYNSSPLDGASSTMTV